MSRSFLSISFFFINADHFQSLYSICHNIASVVCVLVFWPWGLWDHSSLTKDWTLTLCIGRQSLNYWATRKLPKIGTFTEQKGLNFDKVQLVYFSFMEYASGVLTNRASPSPGSYKNSLGYLLKGFVIVYLNLWSFWADICMRREAWLVGLGVLLFIFPPLNCMRLLLRSLLFHWSLPPHLPILHSLIPIALW